MSHYEPREQTEAWRLTIEAHNAAAKRAEHDEECKCAATGDDFSSKTGHAQFADALRAGRDAGMFFYYDSLGHLMRGETEVARWRVAQ